MAPAANRILKELNLLDDLEQQKDMVYQTNLGMQSFWGSNQVHIVDHLRKQGVKVTELKASKRAVGEEFVMSDLSLSKRKFEGHFMANAQGEFVPKTKRFKKCLPYAR